MSTSLRRYYRGDELVGLRDGQASATRYYHFDHQGTTQCLTDRTGGVTDRFASDAWGVPVKRAGTSINRHWYIGNGGYYSKSPFNSTYIRRRHLNPTGPMWLSREPLGLSQKYSYARNRPSLMIDPSGLSAVTDWEEGQFAYPDRFKNPPPGYNDWHGKGGLCNVNTYNQCSLQDEFYYRFSYLFNLRLWRELISHYGLGGETGGIYQGDFHFSSGIMSKLINKSPEDSNLCVRAAQEAAKFGQQLSLAKGCPKSVSIRPTGYIGTPKVQITDDLDLYMSLGGHFAYASALVNCECIGPSQYKFHMQYTYRVTDVSLGDGEHIQNSPVQWPLLDPTLCHHCGWDRDFWVIGEHTRSYDWTLDGRSSTAYYIISNQGCR